MKVEIIAIGDELLIGQTINTNASWLGQEFSLRGYQITRSLAIADDPQQIVSTLDALLPDTNCVIITGGLGPTKDDLTKHTLAAYFNCQLQIHAPTLAQIEAFFESRNKPMLEVNIQQAALPTAATILKNRRGTAAGMWFEKNEIVYISLPGVPYEMKTIMTEEAFPLIEQRFGKSSLFHRTILTQGIGESFLAELIQDWEDRVRNAGLSLAYLPSPGLVKLRLTSFKGKEEEALIGAYFQELQERIPEAIYGEEDQSLAGVLGNLFKERQLTIGTVESCTAGQLANTIAAVEGASAYYHGALLTYSNELKERIAEVSAVTLKQFGAVSEEVAKEMAENGKRILGVDYCLSTTGVAGPTGGTPEKPVGLVWVGLSGPKGTIAKCFRFGDNRQRNLDMTVLSAMNWLRYELVCD
ncbi:MAG: CinA family nicotinamide mononucleotide deamidase-related protein [Flavobacteriales bacterium]